MIQIDFSKALAKPLARHLKPAQVAVPDLYWRADVAMIGAESCIVMQEQYTQYLMVFCGLKGEEFQQFPELFRQRFCRELAAICMQANLYDNKTLIAELSAICDKPYYRLDPEVIEEGKIPKVIEKLERMFLYDNQPLPVEGKAAFEFGYKINSRNPKSSDQESPSAAEALGNLCLNLIETSLAEFEEPKPVVLSSEDNVVRVDFSRQCGQ